MVHYEAFKETFFSRGTSLKILVQQFLFTSIEAFKANFNKDLCIVIFHSHNFRLSRKTSLRNFSFTSLKAFKVNFVELLYILIALKLSRGTLLRIFGQQFFIHINSKRSRRTLF
ncbi:hypothetical protein MRX96_011047 [Rhipicephalus microplus]